MNISKQGDFYLASHITGPGHNALLLALTLDGEYDVPPVVEALTHRNHHHSAPLNEQSVLTAALQGVTEANSENGTSYRVAAMRYYVNDSGPVSIFQYMARKIADHVAREAGNFE